MDGLLVIVLDLRPFLLVLGVYLAGLFKDPATPVGVIAGLSRVPCIWHGRSSMWSKLDEPGLFLLNGFFRWPDLEPLNLALTVMSSVLSLLPRHLCLLHRGLPLLFLASKVPGSLVLLLLRASQLSSPAQKWVMSAVKVDMDFGFSWPRCLATIRHG